MKPSTPVYIRYRDHVLFRNKQSNHVQPAIRECVGWIGKESSEAILIIWDRCVLPLEGNRAQPESGLCILKTDVLRIKEIPFQYRFMPLHGDRLLSGSAHYAEMPNLRLNRCIRRKIRLKKQTEIGKT
jgi:hypothetical protein